MAPTPPSDNSTTTPTAGPNLPAPGPHLPPQGQPSGHGASLPTDVTMASVTQRMESMQTSFNRMQTSVNRLLEQQGQPSLEAPLPASGRRNGGDERLKGQMAKARCFSNLPGENFLAWRAQFQVIAGYNRWSPDEAKQMAFAHMVGTALESVLDIDIQDAHTSLPQLLDQYQNRFLPRSSSQMLRAQFNYVVQLPTESVQKLHSRMRVLYHLAYPDQKDRSEIVLIERFIQALNNREVQNHVRRRKPTKYSDALDFAQEETSFSLIDNITHSPGGPQQPVPGDSSFVGAIRNRQANPGPSRATVANRKCFYCEDVGHFKERCPIRLKDILKNRGLTSKSIRGRTPRTSAPANRARPGTSSTSRRWNPPEARYTTPVVTDGYTSTQPGRRISTIEERGEEEVLDSVEEDDGIFETDLTLMDEATVAALYEEFKDVPIEGPPEEEKDFAEGQ